MNRRRHVAMVGTRPKGGVLQRPRVLEVGPLTPPTGGIQTGIEQLRASVLGQRYFVAVVNTSSGRAREHQGRVDLANIVHAVSQSARLVWQIVAYRPDIVQVHTSCGFGLLKGCWFATLARLLRRKVVLSIHTPYKGDFVPRWARLIVRRALARADAVRVLSPSWKEYFKSEFGLENLWVVPNGVPVPEWHNADSYQADGHGVTTVLSVGMLGRRKGTYELLEAVAVASRRVTLRLELAGPWESREAANDLTELIAKLGLQSTVVLHGEVTERRHLESIYKSADVFVLPSLGEGLPRAVIEAMSYALPVLVTPVGALSEIVRDDVNGIVVPPRDVPLLAEALVRLASDKRLRERLGKSGRQTVVSEYSLEAEIAGWEELYTSIVQRCENDVPPG